MINEHEDHPQQQSTTGKAKLQEGERKPAFNELSELSLEERMAVADRIGIPVEDVREAAFDGTASLPTENSTELRQAPEEFNEDSEPER